MNLTPNYKIQNVGQKFKTQQIFLKFGM